MVVPMLQRLSHVCIGVDHALKSKAVDLNTVQSSYYDL